MDRNDAIRRDYPMSLHGVGLSLGGAEGLDPAHLERIRRVAERVEPALMSEHIASSMANGTYLADLLPLPMTEEALAAVCRLVDQVQGCLRRRILVENPSTYLRFQHSAIPEWEFMAAGRGAHRLWHPLRLNNIFVSAHNHDWNALTYLAALPPAAIGEIHLAGHSVRSLPDGSTLRIDEHGSHVIAQVWALYREALGRFGPVPTLIEWDIDVPPLHVLLGEADRALLDQVPYTLLALPLRVGAAAVFWNSAMANANWDTTIALFTDEYKVPLLPPEFAANLALSIELTTPVLLVLGLFTRATALVLLGMTTVIEIFVYPLAWPTHIQWAAMLLMLRRAALARPCGVAADPPPRRQTRPWRRRTSGRGMQLCSTIACASCRRRRTEIIPADACGFFDASRSCGTRMKPRRLLCVLLIR